MCQSLSFKTKMNIILRVMFHCQHSNQEISLSSMLDTLQAVPKQNGKVFTPSSNNHTLRLIRNNGYRPYQQQSQGSLVLRLNFDLILSMELGIPNTNHFLVNDEVSPLIGRINHLAWKILTAPSRYVSDSGIQNILLFEGLEFGTCKFTWNGR